MAVKKQQSKPGKHGTLYLYRVTYEDSPPPSAFRDVIKMWGYDSEHVEQRFYEAPDADGWRIVKIEACYAYPHD